MKRYTEHSSSSVNDMGLENRQKPVPSKLTVSATKRVVTNRTEDEEVLKTTTGKKSVPTTKVKATKGLKRNLKNWEAFMEEDDDDIAVTGLAFDMELDLDMEAELPNRNRTDKNNKRHSSAG